MSAAIPLDQAVGEIAEQLLSAQHRQDAAAVAAALNSPVLGQLNAQFRGLGNIHIAFAFARILTRECPASARDESAVPRLDLLVGDGAEDPRTLEAHVSMGDLRGRPVSRAEAKASTARFAEGIPLAQRFMRVWILSPHAVPDFVEAQTARSAVMVDAVWGVLYEACATMRFGAARDHS